MLQNSVPVKTAQRRHGKQFLNWDGFCGRVCSDLFIGPVVASDRLALAGMTLIVGTGYNINLRERALDRKAHQVRVPAHPAAE